MTTPSPAQQIAAQIKELQSKVIDLQGKVRLSSVRDSIEDLQTTVTGLGQRITTLRTRGYVFGKDLESQAKTLADGWIKLYPSLGAQVSVQANTLAAAIRPVETQMTQLVAAGANPLGARSLLNSAQAAVSQLEGKVEAAERAIEGMFDQYESQVGSFKRTLDAVDAMLTNLAEASFQLLPTEGGIAAVKAVWCKAGKEQKDDPEGVLFLTDQRLLFEQKEEVATKKVLFVATEKKKMQSLQWEVPVAQIDKISTSKQGILKNEDHIEVRFLPGAALEMAHLHIWQDNATWQSNLNQARAREFDKDRAVAIDQAAIDKVKAAPSQCPSCGGNLSKVVLRGQDSIKCEYCGFIIRL
jgi:hypothetical protein